LIEVEMPPTYKRYFMELEDKLKQLYEVAEKARAKGMDTTLEPEPEITTDIAERVEKLIGPKGITQRMRELEDMDRREMSFKIAQEIALGRYGSMEKERAAEQAIRTGLAIMTEGVTIAPIQGIPEIKIKQNPDRTEYLSLYFAGPIRPAGGTAQALTLVIADVVRKTLGLDRYQPSEDAVNRFIEEVRIYERSVRRFQYHVTDEDLEVALKMLPVEATGVSTDHYEVSNYRDVPGIETNRLRGGALIVVVDGIVGRARKLCGICEHIGIDGWDWLEKLNHKNTDNGDNKPTAAFMEEIIVGRPVFSFPNTPGGFRLRYGRARTTGLAACGVHPATMVTLNGFMTTGLQLRIELPGKSAAVCPVDTIEPPVVKLKDGSVIRVDNVEKAEEAYDDIDEVLFNGDVLINAGDFIQFNQALLPAGYDEDQWRLDVEYAMEAVGVKAAEELTGLPVDVVTDLAADPWNPPTPQEAVALTKIDAPLHPRYTYEWSKTTLDRLLSLRNILAENWSQREHGIRLKSEEKETLETLLVPHVVEDGAVMFGEAESILESCLALDRKYVESDADSPLQQVNQWAGFTVREKAYVYVGARMGRPEKAKERRMSPYVHCIFPVSNAGGPQRDITRAKRGDRLRVQLVRLDCPECGYPARTARCENCGTVTVMRKQCPRCKTLTDSDTCPACNTETVGYDWTEIDLREELENARRHITGIIPNRIKCVKGLMNENRPSTSARVSSAPGTTSASSRTAPYASTSRTYPSPTSSRRRWGCPWISCGRWGTPWTWRESR
jgi:DNA polymerase II large subunit